MAAATTSRISPTLPMVSIIMPALNEEAYIEAAVRSVLPPPDRLECELIVVDGGSVDRTTEIVRELAAKDGRIRLMHNSRKIQSAAVNIAARLADPRSECIVRADCHSRYPEGFVEGCVSTLARLDLASVVVPMRTIGQTCMQRAIAAAQNSRMGNGGSRHRIVGRSGFVEHGHHAAFDRRIFLAVGGYDERFACNEDAELDMRLVQAGQGIYLDAGHTIEYFPRATLWALARQYHGFGWGRADTLIKHRVAPRLRQVAPVVLLAALTASLGLAFADLRALIVPLAYAALVGGWGVMLAARHRSPCLVMSGLAAMVMHLAWGIGHVRRLLAEFGGWRRPRPQIGRHVS